MPHYFVGHLLIKPGECFLCHAPRGFPAVLECQLHSLAIETGSDYKLDHLFGIVLLQVGENLPSVSSVCDLRKIVGEHLFDFLISFKVGFLGGTTKNQIRAPQSASLNCTILGP